MDLENKNKQNVIRLLEWLVTKQIRRQYLK